MLAYRRESSKVCVARERQGLWAVMKTWGQLRLGGSHGGFRQRSSTF